MKHSKRSGNSASPLIVVARWSVAASALAAVALVAMPASGQAPAPACSPDAQIAPRRFDFTGQFGPIQSVAATHAVQLFLWVPDGSPDPGIHLTAPAGLQTSITNRGDPTSLYADFVPTVPGTLPFSATWTQLRPRDTEPCTASASTALAVTQPTAVRVFRTLGYSVDHRPGKPGGSNEFEIRADVSSDAQRGDRSPIRLAVRAVTKARRPSARTPVTSLTLDPEHLTSHGVRASTSLLRLSAGQFADEAGSYEFKVGVFAYARGRRARAHRGVEIVLSQGSRTLTTIRYVTSCSAIFGGLQCTPLPKHAAAP